MPAHTARGNALLFLLRYDAAIEAYRAAGDSEAEATALSILRSGATERDRGNAAFKANKFTRAERHFTAALAAQPGGDDRAVLLSNRSAARLSAGRIDAAEADARSAVSHSPLWAKAHVRLGDALLRKSDAAGAESAYRRALQLDATSAFAAAGVASCCALQASGRAKADGDAAFARADFSAAAAAYSIALSSSDAMPAEPRSVLLSNRSAAFAKLADWPRAESDARDALALRPGWPTAASRLAAALHGAGEAEVAYIHCACFLASAHKAGVAQSELAGVTAARDAARECFLQCESNACRRRIERAESARRLHDARIRVFVTSDVHVDVNGNLGWCERLSTTAFQLDVLVVAGDLGDTLNACRRGLRALKSKFGRVFYAPGNHDLWVRPGLEAPECVDSFCKLFALLGACDQLGVDAVPAVLSPSLAVAPLLTWYSHCFDEADPTPGALRYDSFATFPGCASPATTLLRANEPHIARLQARLGDLRNVVSFSHFLPRNELFCSGGVPELRKNVGCKAIDLQVQRLLSTMHVYGHTHINADGAVGGDKYVVQPGGALAATGGPNEVRYVQSALEGGAPGLLCVLDKGMPSARHYGQDGCVCD